VRLKSALCLSGNNEECSDENARIERNLIEPNVVPISNWVNRTSLLRRSYVVVTVRRAGIIWAGVRNRHSAARAWLMRAVGEPLPLQPSGRREL
jgi:hypothetical protein